MHITKVIKKPVITEKSTKQNNNNQLVFEVDYKATKPQIKRAFEIIFEMKVEKINIIKSKPKAKKMGRFEGLTNARKRAIIFVNKNEKIDLFSQEQS